MECVMNEAPGDWVSHSFAQFILSDGESVYRLDLGEANPRAVNLAKSVVYKEPDDVWTWYGKTETRSLLDIIGSYGDNVTGVSMAIHLLLPVLLLFRIPLSQKRRWKKHTETSL